MQQLSNKSATCSGETASGSTRSGETASGSRSHPVQPGPDELHDLGFDLIVHPLTALLDANKAIAGVYQTLRAAGTARGATAAIRVPPFSGRCSDACSWRRRSR
jgi:hypothetical protein